MSDTSQTGFPRPVTFAGSLGVSWRTFRGRFHVLVGLFIVVYIVASTLPYALFAALPSVSRTVVGVQLLYLAVMFGLSVCTAVAAVIVVDEYAGKTTLAREAWRTVIPRLRDVFIVCLITSLFALLLSQVLFAGYLGLLLTVAIFMGPPVVVQVLVVEELPLREAWARSRELLKMQWGRTIMYIFNIALLSTFVTAFAVQSFILETTETSDVLSFLMTRVIEAILYAGSAAFLAVLGTTIYLDIRARKEGLDEETLAEERFTEAVASPG